MGKRNTTWTLVICAAIAASACSVRQTPMTTDGSLERQLEEKAQEVVELKSSLDRAETDLAKQKAEAEAKAREAEAAQKVAREAEAKARAAAERQPSPPVAAPAAAGISAELLPPNPRPGACYARVFIPPTFGTETERVLKTQASERIEVVPAKYEWAEQQVLVKEASERLEVVPARYKTVQEKVLVKEASTEVVQVPAEHEWVEEKILVEPAQTVWKKGRGPIEKIDNATGEIMCLVEVPAKYKTVRKQVLKTPATTKTIAIPAEYKTVKKTVLAEPATVRKVTIPAEYSTIKVQKMASPPQERRVEIPEEWTTVSKTVKRSDEKLRWREVLCETNMTRGTVTELQRTLQRAGHNPGPIDGIYGRQTAAAVRSFQQAKGLPTGGLTLETLEKLGVKL